MGKPTVIEVDYYKLLEDMKRATDAKCLIERKDSEKWKAYVTENKVGDTSLEAFGKVKFMTGKPKLVAIVMGNSSDGCYAYSSEDEAALKWEAGD